MKKMYKDIRSMKSWLSRKLESDASNRVLQFHTLDSLTPDKISDIIRENFIDETDDKIPKWLRDQMDRNPRPIKKEDSDDQRLISLILFVVDHILSARIHNRKAFNKESGAVKVSTSALRQIVNDGSYIKHVMDVAQATSILSMVSQYVHKEDGEGEARTYRIHLGHITKEGNALAIVPCPDTKIAQKILAYKRRNQIRNERLPRVGSNKVLLSSLYQLSHLSGKNAQIDQPITV
jgi:hypothetical protein